MIYIWISIFVLFALSCWSLWGWENIDSLGNVYQFVGVVGLCLSAFFFLITISLHGMLYVSGQQALFINKEFNTNYTRRDVFLYGNTIVNVLKIKRQQVEVRQ